LSPRPSSRPARIRSRPCIRFLSRFRGARARTKPHPARVASRGRQEAAQAAGSGWSWARQAPCPLLSLPRSRSRPSHHASRLRSRQAGPHGLSWFIRSRRRRAGRMGPAWRCADPTCPAARSSFPKLLAPRSRFVGDPGLFSGVRVGHLLQLAAPGHHKLEEGARGGGLEAGQRDHATLRRSRCPSMRSFDRLPELTSSRTAQAGSREAPSPRSTISLMKEVSFDSRASAGWIPTLLKNWSVARRTEPPRSNRIRRSRRRSSIVASERDARRWPWPTTSSSSSRRGSRSQRGRIDGQ